MFTADQLSELSHGDLAKIRNLSVIAHVDHGKTTLSDGLLKRAGAVSASSAGDKCGLDTLPEEQEGGITIKSTGFTAAYSLDDENLLVNLIDSPGHIDFNSEVTAALRVTDGSFVVVDCVEGVCVQTKTVLQQALQEMVVPTLVLNKVDRVFVEMGWDGEETKRRFEKIIEDINVVIETYSSEVFRPPPLDILAGNVMIASGYHQYGFRLCDLAPFFGEDVSVKSLWKNFATTVFPTLAKVIRAIDSERPDLWQRMMTKIGVKIDPKSIVDMTKKKLVYRAVIGKWLPVGNAVLRMARDCLPNPREAQAYRAGRLWQGRIDTDGRDETESKIDVDDPAYRAMVECDKEGPLMMYVCKMVPKTEDAAQFFAFGRIFSGTLRPGQKVYLLHGDFVHGKSTLVTGSAQQTVSMLGSKILQHTHVTAGNTCAVLGFEKHITKTGTVTSEADVHPLLDMKYSVQPIVRMAVTPGSSADQSYFVTALQKLRLFDPLVSISTDEDTGEVIIGAAGELHLRICTGRLQRFMRGRPLKLKEPMVSYRETVSIPQEVPGLTKSPNSHNRLYMQAFPLPAELVSYLESHTDLGERDPKEILRLLETDPSLPPSIISCLTPKRVWGFGPEDAGTNILFDATTGEQYMHEIKQSVLIGFGWATRTGPLAGEPLTGVGFAIMDVKLHSDAIHRGMGQIVPTSRKGVLGNILKATPRFFEPIFLASITVPSSYMGGVFSVLAARRGEVVEQTILEGRDQMAIQAYLPVAESFGFVEDLRSETSGYASPQLVFDHWELLSGDPYEEGSLANKIALQIRERKGLPLDLPLADTYLNKL